MAKVIGPLHSESASGQFAKAQVHARRKGQNVVRAYIVPANPRSQAQMEARAKFSVPGRIVRRVKLNNLSYAGEAASMEGYWRSQTTDANVWNSLLARAMLGPGNATYDGATAEYAGLTQNVRDAWQAAATTQVAGFSDAIFQGVTVTAGFQAFLLERTNAEAGYGDPFDNETPTALVAFTG